ncbi:hypothetical protein GLOIN_2v1804780 [Rhizophagus clarus]|uniref:Uncharacterized protein n=1 Tax=Rhizophagus clarus TaxID=94130 RepID=A0A8H3LS60_9GLOM|nr:hypothetical protein GLOIN_2v1804780 [Rhizophagus clarus]
MVASLSKVLSLTFSVAFIVIGLAMSYCGFPIPISFFGFSCGSISTMFISAGCSGVLACLFNDDLGWDEWLKEIFKGAFTGLISTLSSEVAGHYVNKIIKLDCLEKIVRTFIGSSSSIVFRNYCDKSKKPLTFKDFRDIFFSSILSYGISIGFEKKYEKIAKSYANLYQKTKSRLDKSEFVDNLSNHLKNWRAKQPKLYIALDFCKNIATNVGIDSVKQVIIKNQKVKINRTSKSYVLTVLMGAFESTTVSFVQSGINYRDSTEKEDKHIYRLAKMDKEGLNIRNEVEQNFIGSLNNNREKVEEHFIKPFGIDPSYVDLDSDNDCDIKDNDSTNDDKAKQNTPNTPNTRDKTINESRSWNEGAKIYSTRDAIETFRSQNERYNYIGIADETGHGADQTPTNPEYVHVYAHSNSNLPVTSSFSTNKDSQNPGRKGKFKSINNRSPDLSLSNQDNQYFVKNPNKHETVNEASSHLTVKPHPIICWDADEQKYVFSDPNGWPAFPHKTKVIGFVGTKKSGRTTAIHSLLFELGYFLTEEQMAKSLLPIGVMMYVLKKHDLILLDCCDIADSSIAEAGNLLSGYLLEFFTYMASCHLVIHTAIPQKEEGDRSMFSEMLTNYIHTKAKLQLLWSNTIQTFGPSMLTVLVRGTKQQCEEMNLDKNNLFSSQSSGDDYDKITFTHGFQDSKAFVWKYIPEEMITKRTLANDEFAFPSAILKRIKDETEPHGLSISVQASMAGITAGESIANRNLEPFYNRIEANWKHLFNEIMTNSVLTQSVSDFINYETIKEADDQTGGLIQEYIESVNKLVKNSATQGSALETNFKAIREDFKKRLDIEMNKSVDKRDPTISIKLNIEIAKCLLESSKTETNLEIKENLISWGLHGLTLIRNCSTPKVLEHAWIKLCIKTYNILEILNTPVIYNVHWHCWNFLSFANSCGFKLELIEWQILERALYCLKSSANKPRFHFHVLNCLLNFLETEPYLPVIINPSIDDMSSQTSSLQLNEEQYYQLKQMTYYGIMEYSKQYIREAAEKRKSTNTEKFLKDITNFVNKQIKISISSAVTSSYNEPFSVLPEHQQFAIVSVALERLNTGIALYVSKYIFDSEGSINVFLPDSPIETLQDYHEKVHNYRWLFLQRIASLQDDECTQNLIENTLSSVLSFLKNLPYDEASKKSHSYAVRFVNTLMFAENIMKKRRQVKKSQVTTSSSRQPMTIADINKKKERIEDEEYGEVRMELLSQRCFKPVLQEFLRGLKSKDQKECLCSDKVRRYTQYINNLLFAPHNSRIQALSLDQMPVYERNMLRIMTFRMMDLCINTLWKHDLENENKEFAESNQISIVYNTRAFLRLLNRIHWMMAKKDKNKDIQGPSIIFGSSTNTTSGQSMIHSLPSSNDTHSSEILADEMIQRIGLINWQNLITLISIPRTLSDHASKVDPDNSLNFREAIFDVRDEALILLWNLSECSGVSLGVSKKVMTTNDFRPANVIGEFSATLSFDENGINRIKFLVNRVINQINTNTTTVKAEITNQELHNCYRIGKIRAIELTKRATISENIEKQMEEQKLKPDVQAMKEARLRRFNNK